MTFLSVEIKKLSHALDLEFPTYKTSGSAGMDLSAAIEHPMIIPSGKSVLIPTGFSIALPLGYEGQLRPRSGLALKYGVTVLNTPGTIDADYRGELQVILMNHSSEPFVIERGMRIAQLVVAKVEHVQWVSVKEHEETMRGCGGFGSTGL